MFPSFRKVSPPARCSGQALWHPSMPASSKPVGMAGSILLLVALLLVLLPAAVLRAQTGATADPPTIHVVAAGETLSEIAKAYGVTLADLMAENGITDPDSIIIGQELQLPAAVQPQPTAAQLSIHVVQAGETLSEIAKQYGVSLTRLMLVNGIQNADAVYAGQELTIPRPASAERAAAAEAVETLVAAVDTPPDRATATPTPPAAQATAVITAPVTGVDNEPADATAEPATPTATDPTVTPDADTSAAVTTDSAPVAPMARIASLNQRYQVRSGDTFARIALRLGVDAEALRRLNRLSSDDLTNLRAGQELLLPATGTDLQVRKPAQTYVVQPGDSLGSIANQFELTLADLLAANGIADPNLLAVGQQLTIPAPSAAAEDDAPVRVGPQRSGFYYYTVQPGETTSELAQAFNTSQLAILEYNGLPDEETVYAGLEIRIPYGPPVLPQRRPPVPASGTSFLVSLSRQACWLFAGDRVVYSWNCSTGYGEWITRVGSFAVQSKIEMAQSSAYRLDMPYWLGIYNVGDYENGIHGLPVEWDTGEKIWERLIGEPATFGCAMLDDRDAVVLFTLAYIGMPVHIIN